MAAKLVIPCEQYLQSYLEACLEFKTHGVALHSFHDPDQYDAWKDTIFQTYDDNRHGRNLPLGFIPSSMFWLVENQEFIGAGNIRHTLTLALEKFGGHIGYVIRFSRWGQGYGTLQLKLLLQQAYHLGIHRALVTCDEGNIASARVMQKNDGIYQDTIDHMVDGQPRRIKRYWFGTTPA